MERLGISAMRLSARLGLYFLLKSEPLVIRNAAGLGRVEILFVAIREDVVGWRSYPSGRRARGGLVYCRCGGFAVYCERHESQ